MSRIIACDPIIGLPRIPSQGRCPDINDLLSEMERLGVEAAIVRHQATLDCGPIVGNQLLAETVKDHPRLKAALFVTPDGFEPSFDVEQMIDNMLQSGTQLCWTDHKAENFSLLPWCSGPLYEILQSRQIPLMLNYTDLQADALDLILSSFPKLNIILLNVPRLGRNRMIYPLLRRHSRLHLCLSHTYSVQYGIEDLCNNFGPDRWVFGTGYPQAEGGAAITGLTYADIDDDTKAAIAHKNIERLLSEAKQ